MGKTNKVVCKKCGVPIDVDSAQPGLVAKFRYLMMFITMVTATKYIVIAFMFVVEPGVIKFPSFFTPLLVTLAVAVVFVYFWVVVAFYCAYEQYLLHCEVCRRIFNQKYKWENLELVDYF